MTQITPSPVFPYGPKEIEELARRDERLAQAIRRIGLIQRPIVPDLFEALISSIVSQQIAKKAYETVWNRLKTLTGPVTAQNILSLDRDRIKACGLSYKKTDWILTIAGQVDSGELDLTQLHDLPDEEVIRRLSQLPGIGRWTAEMLLIFSLQRPDVLSYGDLAIRRGIQTLYGMEALTKAQFEEIRRRLSPYNSIASLYFWELSHEPIPSAAVAQQDQGSPGATE